MKLSDIKGERTLDVIADIIDPLANIAGDKKAMELFTKKKLPEGKTPREFAVERVRKNLPAMLKHHKKDIITILAAVEGVAPEEYSEELNLVKLFQDAIDLLTDQAFMQLFISAQTGNSSGAAQETSEAEA